MGVRRSIELLQTNNTFLSSWLSRIQRPFFKILQKFWRLHQLSRFNEHFGRSCHFEREFKSSSSFLSLRFIDGPSTKKCKILDKVWKNFIFRPMLTTGLNFFAVKFCAICEIRQTWSAFWFSYPAIWILCDYAIFFAIPMRVIYRLSRYVYLKIIINLCKPEIRKNILYKNL